MSQQAEQQREWLAGRLAGAPYAWVYRESRSRGGGKTGQATTLHRAECSVLLRANGVIYGWNAEEAEAYDGKRCGRCKP